MSVKSESCCGEKVEDSSESTVHKIPALAQPAPFWSGTAVMDLKFRDLSLVDFREKYLVLLFYPHDFTFVCPTELIQFSDRVDKFQQLGAEVVAVSTDSEYSHLAWITTPRKQGGLGEMKIPVLADRNHEISRKYGVLNEKEGISLKALFVIDEDQRIRYVAISENAVPRCVDEVLRVIKACQFVDKYGHTCPMNPKKTDSNHSINA